MSVSPFRIVDLSQPLFDECPNCPVHPGVRIERIADHPEHDWRMEKLTMASHTGSHIDAPLHKIAGGKTIDQLPLESFLCEAVLLDLRPLTPGARIGAEILQTRCSSSLEGRVVLLATGWGEKRAKTQEWHYDSPFLTPDGASWLVAQGITGVGIDHYSMGGSKEPENAQTHEVLLSKDIWILEELRFPEEIYAYPKFILSALPINLQEHSGAFCRPVALLPR